MSGVSRLGVESTCGKQTGASDTMSGRLEEVELMTGLSLVTSSASLAVMGVELTSDLCLTSGLLTYSHRNPHYKMLLCPCKAMSQ